MSSHYWVRRKPPVWVALVVGVGGLLLVGVGQILPNRQSIEDNLTKRSTIALEQAGISGVEVKFAGRDGSLVVASAADVDRARSVVEGVEGVRVVSARGPAVTIPTRSPSITATLNSGQVTLAGSVPNEAARKALTEALGGSQVQDQLTVDGGVSDANLSGLPAVVRALGGTVKGVVVELRDGRITLTGTVDSTAVRDAAVAAAGQAVGGASVTDKLQVVAPPEVIQRELISLPPITFENDSATLTTAGQAAVTRAADILRANPSAKVRIEGHTDGNGTAESNLALSQARAQAVLNALVSLGISADRLTAVGFGETQHKVPDTTPENRAINRRVEFVVLP